MNELREFLREVLNLREGESTSEFTLYFVLTIVSFLGILLYVWYM
jgi:hypothetical protein